MIDNLDPSVDAAALAITNLLSGRPRDAAAEPAPSPEPVEAAAPEAGEEPAPEHIPDEASPEGDAPVEEAPQGDEPKPVVMPAPAPVVAPQAAQPPAPNINPQAASANNILAQLNAIVPQLQVQLAAQFPEIRTDDDLIRVAQEDPARALQFKLQSDRLTNAINLQSRAMAEHQTHWKMAEGAKLAQFPEFSDPVKGPALENSVRAYAAKIGYPPEVIANASALDIVNMHKVMLHDQRAAKDAQDKIAQAEALKQAKAKAADAPPVQKPGAQRTTEKADKFKDTRARLRKTGSVDDAAQVFSLLG